MWHPECLRVDSPNFGYPRGTRGQLRVNVQAIGGGGAFFHSTVGAWQAARDRFLNPAEEASAHFIIRQAGAPLQMVDSADPAWHAGGQIHDDPLPGGPVIGDYANLFFHGFEFEGGAAGNVNEPLTENQKVWAVKLCHWLEVGGDWPRARVYILKETLWEHNWVYPTACPSGRIPWPQIIAALQEDSNVPTQQEWDDFKRENAEGHGRLNGYINNVQADLDNFKSAEAQANAAMFKDLVAAIKAASAGNPTVAAVIAEIEKRLQN